METQKAADGTHVFTIIIPWSEVQPTYAKLLDDVVAQATLPGFRQGKAPRNMVEEKAGKNKLYSDVIERVLPPAYKKEVESRNLKPYISPRVKPITLDEGKDWQFEITVIGKPEVKLGDYEAKLRERLATGKIVVPGKKEEQSRDEKLKIAFDTVLESADVQLPQLLVDEEVNARLAQLVDQLTAVGLTVEQYLKTRNLDPVKLRGEYERTARDVLKLNLALDQIATGRGFAEKDRIAKAVDWLISL